MSVLTDKRVLGLETSKPERKRSRHRSLAASIALYTWLILMAAQFCLPLVWATASSFKPRGDIFSYPPRLLPTTTTVDNYRNLLETTPFWNWYAMSIIVGLISTVITLFVCALAGFGFAKYNFRGKNFLFDVLFSSLAVPFAVIIVPLFILMVKMGLTNPYFALIVPWIAPAFGIFMMRQFISQTIPDELMEAARLDGCSEFGIFWRVAVPLIRPAVGALGVWTFINAYNSFLWPLIVVQNPKNYTIPLGLNALFSTQYRAYDLVLAGSVLATIPTIVVFIVLRKQLLSGLTAGAVRG